MNIFDWFKGYTVFSEGKLIVFLFSLEEKGKMWFNTFSFSSEALLKEIICLNPEEIEEWNHTLR